MLLKLNMARLRRLFSARTMDVEGEVKEERGCELAASKDFLCLVESARTLHQTK